jgi:hypothetical protein
VGEKGQKDHSSSGSFLRNEDTPLPTESSDEPHSLPQRSHRCSLPRCSPLSFPGGQPSGRPFAMGGGQARGNGCTPPDERPVARRKDGNRFPAPPSGRALQSRRWSRAASEDRMGHAEQWRHVSSARGDQRAPVGGGSSSCHHHGSARSHTPASAIETRRSSFEAHLGRKRLCRQPGGRGQQDAGHRRTALGGRALRLGAPCPGVEPPAIPRGLVVVTRDCRWGTKRWLAWAFPSVAQRRGTPLGT